MLTNLAYVPDYMITIYMKIGPHKQGVRWHPAYDVNQVRSLVEKKIERTLGRDAVQGIDIALVSNSTFSHRDTKNLSME